MSAAANEHSQMSVVPNGDGTATVHYVSLDAGYARVENLSIIETFNLSQEIERADDAEAVMVKWANGYRDANMYELADCGDDWQHVLTGIVRSKLDADVADGETGSDSVT